MTNIIAAQFWSKCAAIKHRWVTTYGTNELEDLLLDLLEFVKNHPEERDNLVEGFLQLVDQRDKGPFEILVFCMRELRWTAVRDRVAAKIRGSDDPRVGNALGKVLAVYEDEWPDADLYDYYRAE